MAEKTNLAQEIIKQSSELFRRQGYAATSIKQIAQASGCTTAALYYYYEGGKQQILREVIRSSALERKDSLATADTAVDLPSFLRQLALNFGSSVRRMTQRVNWLLLEFPTLPVEEQQFLLNQLHDFHATLQSQLENLVADEATADRLAWMVFCSYFGYQQLFITMGLEKSVEFELEDFGQFLEQMITTANS